MKKRRIARRIVELSLTAAIKLTLDNDTSETQGNSTLFIAADKLDMY